MKRNGVFRQHAPAITTERQSTSQPFAGDTADSESEVNSRERVFSTLRHHPTDRIPVDFWASGSMKRKMEIHTGLTHAQFLDAYNVDFRYIEGPAYIGPPLRNRCDIWGVSRRAIDLQLPGGRETYSELQTSPLAEAERVADVEGYAHWPSPDWFDYDDIERQCDEVLHKGRVVVFMGDRLNRAAQLKPAMYLRGMENIFLDMAVRKSMAEAIFARIRSFYTAYLERILEAANGKVDIVLTGDDFGAQNGLLLSVGMWRHFLRPGFADYIEVVKRHGARAMHHTCGSVAPLIPDLVSCGLDILQSIQPEAVDMELANLMDKFGDRLSFHGGVSIQQAMPFGSPEDIRRQVREIAEVARARGGYVFCTAHNIQADTPVANVIALLAAYHDYGQFGPSSAK